MVKSRRPASLKATKRGRVVEELEQARIDYTKAQGGHRKALDRAVMKSIEKAEVLENDAEECREFQVDDTWSGRKVKPETLSDSLFFSLVWVLSNRQQASKIHTAVRPLYRDTSLSAADIVKHVRDNGGYEKLASAHRQKPRNAKGVSIEVGVPGCLLQDRSFPYELRIVIVGAKGQRLLGQIEAP